MSRSNLPRGPVVGMFIIRGKTRLKRIHIDGCRYMEYIKMGVGVTTVYEDKRKEV
jgi:hypothetical protein